VKTLDRVHDLFGLAETPGEVCRGHQRGSGNLGIDPTDLVQQSGATDQIRLGPDLGGHVSGDQTDLETVLQQVLAVNGPELHPADLTIQTRVKVGDAELERGLAAAFLDKPIDLGADALDNLLDPGRVDPAVLDQPFNGDAGDLPADGIERGDQNRSRRVVNDQVYARGSLEGADVPALPSDDPALHLVIGELDEAHRGLDRALHVDPLRGLNDELGRVALGLLPGLVLDLAGQAGARLASLVFDSGNQLGPSFGNRQACDALEVTPGGVAV
jgi:hypothetical protein